jgi:predicted outer membrane repeat protein
MLEQPTSIPSTQTMSHTTRASKSSSSFSHRPSRDHQRLKSSIAGTLLVSMILASCTPPVPSGPGTLTVISVSSVVDAIDTNPGDNVCADAQTRCTLRAAIMESNIADGIQTINIPVGTYTLTIAGAGDDAARSGDLDITAETILVGADMASTIVNANGLDRVFETPNKPGSSSRVTVKVKNLTVRGGTASGDGGGWLSSGFSAAALTFENLTFDGNSSTQNGGGLLVDNAVSLSLAGVRLTNNSAGGNGGGLYANTDNAIIKGSSFTGNTAKGSPTVGSKTGGGGLFTSGTLEISNTVISTNTAPNASGAGIFNAGRLTVNTSSVNKNDAKVCGGGMVNDGDSRSTSTVTSSSITVNSATDGAGLCSQIGPINITNATISGNKASGTGGGISARYADVTVVHSTLANNTAIVEGADLYADGTDSYTVRASILASAGGKACAQFGGGFSQFTSTGANVVADSSCGFSSANDLQSSSAQLAVLSAVTGQVFSVHVPASTSPAINRVPSGLCVSSDARGVTRPQGVACDSGAVERTGTDP